MTFILNKHEAWGVKKNKKRTQPALALGDPAVRLTNLDVGYGSNVVIHNISASFETGSCVAITGNNGSGKSTLLKALIGTVPIMSGEIDVLGYERTANHQPVGSPPWNEVGYVPQRLASAGGVESTVEEVVRSGLLGVGRLFPPRDGKQKVERALQTVGMRHRRKEAFQVLSGGQQQRVLIARALVRDPSLLLFDEPLTGLDRYNRLRLKEIIENSLEGGATAILVLHELGELRPLIDREIHIGGGHILRDGPVNSASEGDREET